MSLNVKITLSLLLLVALLSATFWQFSQQQAERRDQMFLQQLHHSLAENLVNEGPLFVDGQIQPDALEHVFHTLMVVNPSIEVYLLDPAGNILSYSAPYRRVQTERVRLRPIEQFIDRSAALPLRGDNPRAPGQQQVFSAAPIHQNELLLGYLYVVLGGDLHQAAAAKTALAGVWQTAGVGSLIARFRPVRLFGGGAL